MQKYVNTPDEVAEDKLLRRAFSNNVIKGINKEARTIDFVISTASVDRYGDIIDVNGWDLKNYKANPVVLFGHMSHIPPIGKALKTWKEGDALRSTAEFMPQDISPFAHSIFRMFEEGYLRAVSVGFKPKDWVALTDDDGDWCGWRFKKSELLEFSAVPIPANPDALVDARRKGIDTSPFKTWAEEMLDRWNETADPLQKLYGVDRQKMENVRRRAAGVGMSIHVSPDVQDALMKKNLEAIRAAKAAKAKSQETTTVSIRGTDYELPVVDLATLKVGNVVVSVDEVNGKKMTTIDKADDSAVFTRTLVDDATDNIDVTVRANEDEADDLVLTLRADNLSVDYILLGVTANDELYGLKSVDETDEEEEEEEDKSASEEDEDEEDKSASDEDEDEDEDEADEGEKSSPVTEQKDTPAVQTPTTETNKAVEEDETIDLPTRLFIIEEGLLELEKQLDESVSEKKSLRDQRRMKFLAGYMRDLADRLDGGEGTKAAPVSTIKQAPTPVTDGLSPDAATSYAKELLKGMQPLLTELVAQKIGKIKGRLD